MRWFCANVRSKFKVNTVCACAFGTASLGGRAVICRSMAEDNDLDDRFRQLISDMKPHTKGLPYKSEERHKVTLWIKKLLAIKTQMKERNAYAEELLQMLKLGKLREPFTSLPSLGPLLPRNLRRSPPTLWAPLQSGNSSNTTSKFSPLLLGSFHPPMTSSLKGDGMTSSGGVALSCDNVESVSGDDFKPLSLCSIDESLSDESDVEATPMPRPLTTQPLPYSTATRSGSKLTSDIIEQRELELSLRSAEIHHQEEKLRLQREHEDAIQQLLNKRGKEVEEVRRECKKQVEEKQLLNTQLEKTVADLRQRLTELSSIGESGGHGNHLLLQTRQQIQAEFDNKLHRVMTDFERQKLEQDQRHTKHVQQVVSDCGRRIDKMERDCAAQISTSNAVLAEMEGRVQELIQQNQSITSENESLHERLMATQRELEGEKRQSLTRIEEKLREKKTSHTQEKDKLLKKISELEKMLKQQEKTQHETAETHHKEMREVKKQMEELHSHLRVSEGRLARMKGVQERQGQEAEVAIEQFKTQIEQQSNEVFSGLRGELERLAGELAECREERRSSAEKWEREKAQERQRITFQLQSIEASHSQEKEELITQHNIQLETHQTDREQEVSRLQHKIAELQTNAKAAASRNTRTVSSLEEKLEQLQKEAESQRARHSQEIARLRKRLEEEKQNSAKTKETAVLEVREEWQEERKQIKLAHQRQMNSLKDKHNTIVQKMEQDSATETAKATEVIASLQAQSKLLKSDLARHESSMREKLAEAERAREEETASLTQHHHLMLQSVREEADASQQLVTQLQTRITQLQQDHQSKISNMRLQFQTSLSGMMPVTVKKDYETTIQALRSQMEFVEQRRNLLQQELDQLRTVLSSQHHTHTIHAPTSTTL